MDDAVAAAVQARLTRHVVDRTGIDAARLWWQYFQLGGEVGALEIDAYLHACLDLPAVHRDLLACAANELVRGTPCPRVPFTWEMTGPRQDFPARRRGTAPEHGTRG